MRPRSPVSAMILITNQGDQIGTDARTWWRSTDSVVYWSPSDHRCRGGSSDRMSALPELTVILLEKLLEHAALPASFWSMVACVLREFTWSTAGVIRQHHNQQAGNKKDRRPVRQVLGAHTGV